MTWRGPLAPLGPWAPSCGDVGRVETGVRGHSVALERRATVMSEPPTGLKLPESSGLGAALRAGMEGI